MYIINVGWTEPDRSNIKEDRWRRQGVEQSLKTKRRKKTIEVETDVQTQLETNQQVKLIYS